MTIILPAPVPSFPCSISKVISTRGAVIENTHLLNVAIVDSTGRLLWSTGDPERVTLLRSAAKPGLAVAVLEAGTFDAVAFDDADLAMMVASHSGEERHVEMTRRMLEKAGAKEHDFKCGGHPSLSDKVNRDWADRGVQPSDVHNNCSGKHVGLMAAANLLSAVADTGAGDRHNPSSGEQNSYHLPSSPIQQYVRAVFKSLVPGPVHWATDGCNLPTPACSLTDFARLYASMADAASNHIEAEFFDLAIDAKENHRRQHLRRIFTAMHTYPELVAGEGRVGTLLMRLCGDRLIVKIGADACAGISVRASAETRALGAVGGLGIAIKVEDGHRPALYAVLIRIVEDLGMLTLDEKWTKAEIAALDALRRPVGEMYPV